MNYSYPLLFIFLLINCSIFDSSKNDRSPSLLTAEFSEISSYGTAKIGSTHHTLDHFQFQVDERPPNPDNPYTVFTIYSGTQDVNASPFYSFVFDYIFYETDISSDTLFKFPEQLANARSGPPFTMVIYAFEDFDSFVEDSLWAYKKTNQTFPSFEIEIDFLEDGVNMDFDGYIVKDIIYPRSRDSVVTFNASYKLKYK